MVDYLEVFTDGLVLTSLFWDCQCEQDYIQPQALERCPRCGVARSTQPYSHANEILELCPERLTPEQYAAFVQVLKERTEFKPSPDWDLR